MKNIFILVTLVLVFCIACQRSNVPYAGVADTESDKTALQPDPARSH